MSNNKKQPEHFSPKGAMLIVIIFLITLIVLWGSVYYILISRGVTV